MSAFGMALDSAVDSGNIFPIFSEYQVYGNLVKDNPSPLHHTMLGPDNYNHFTSNLPAIKCNSRQESAYSVYEEILNGLYSGCSDRNQVLQSLRVARQAVNPNEEWC